MTKPHSLPTSPPPTLPSVEGIVFTLSSVLHGDFGVGQHVTSSCHHENNISHEDSAQGHGVGDERQRDSLKFFLPWEGYRGAAGNCGF